MSRELTTRPRMSEKAYGQSQALNVYTFSVPASASKHVIATSIAEQFGVIVTKVNIMNQKGKTKRTTRKNGRSVFGTRPDMKKAYITVKEGQVIPIFAAEEEADAKEAAKAAKAEKKEKK